MFPKYEYRNYPTYVGERKHQGSYPARFHKHLEAMLVKSSQVKVTIDGTAYILQPGDLYVAFPNVLHAIEAYEAEALMMIVDFEKYPAFHDVLLHNRPEPPVLRAGEYDPVILDIFQRMVQLITQDSPYRQEALAGYANALLGELLNNLQLVERSTDSSLLQEMIFYILQNYTKPITLEHAAQSLGYSKFYISRTISGLFGCNFRSLINSYRVSMAQNLLVTTDQPVGQIAKACGFQNQSAFNRIFLDQVGIAPGQYRKQAVAMPEMPAVYVSD